MSVGQMSALTKRPAIGLSYEDLIRSQAAYLPQSYAIADSKAANQKEYALKLKELDDQKAYYDKMAQLSADEAAAAEESQTQNMGMGLLSTGLSAYQLWNKVKGAKDVVDLAQNTSQIMSNMNSTGMGEGLSLGTDVGSTAATEIPTDTMLNPGSGILDQITNAISPVTDPVKSYLNTSIDTTLNNIQGMATEAYDGVTNGLSNLFSSTAPDTVNVGASTLGQGIGDASLYAGGTDVGANLGADIVTNAAGEFTGGGLGGIEALASGGEAAPVATAIGDVATDAAIGVTADTATSLGTSAAGEFTGLGLGASTTGGAATGGASAFGSATAGGLYAAAAILAKDYATAHLSDDQREEAKYNFGTPKEDLYLMAEAPVYAGTTMGGPEMLRKLIGDNPLSSAGDWMKDVEMKVTSEITNFIGDVVSDVFDAVGGLFCFVPGTQVMMANGQAKAIENVHLLEEVALGGYVNARAELITDNLYDYNGVKVSGSHAVCERGVWKRVEDSEDAVLLFDDRTCKVYTLNTTKHRLLINGIVFADYGEVTDSECLTPEQRLEILNKDEASSVRQKETLPGVGQCLGTLQPDAVSSC